MPKKTHIVRHGAGLALVLGVLAGSGAVHADEASASRPALESDRIERTLVRGSARSNVSPGFMSDLMSAYESEARKGRSLEEAKQAVGAHRQRPVDREIRSEIDARLRARPADAR